MIGDGLWLFFWGLCYFHGIETGNRFFEHSQALQKQGVSESDAVDDGMRLPSVAWWDVRVVAYSAALAAPALFGGMVRDDAKFLFWCGVSLSAFLNGLAPGSDWEPKVEDMGNPLRLVVKWAGTKLDQFVKVVVIGGAVWLITMIPWIGPMLRHLGEIVFVIIPHGKQPSVFEQLVSVPPYNTWPLFLLLMLILRLLLIAGRPWPHILTFLISVPCIFVGYQAMMDQAMDSFHRLAPSFLTSVAAALAIDFTATVTGLFIQRAGENADRHGR